MSSGFSDDPKPWRTPKRGPKRAVNVSVDAEVLAAAKALDINISQTLEDELRRKVHDEKVRRFKEESREAIEAYNRFIEENGIWSEKFRTW
jgi:antitoxin CcdA